MLSGSVLTAPATTPPRGGVTTLFANGQTIFNAVAQQSDGKIVAAGSSRINGHSQIVVARYDPDGSLDPSFGTGGFVLSELAADSTANAVAVEASGNILVAGSSAISPMPNYDLSSWALVRYKPNGTPDPTFGVDGVSAATGQFGGSISAMVLTPDGQIDVAGSTNSKPVAVARVKPDGTLDQSFGNAGLAATGYDNTANGSVRAMLLQPDGRIVVSGFAAAGITFGMIRFKADGTVDSSFGSNGVVTTVYPQGNEQPGGIALGPGGTIVAVGSVDNGVGGLSDDAVARYLPDGSLDPSFGNGGLETFDIHWYDALTSVLITSTGEIIAGGESQPLGDGEFTLVKLEPDGSFDPAFGNNGIVVTMFTSQSVVQAMAFTADGRILAVGDAWGGTPNQQGGMAIYQPDGALDNSFGVPYDINGDGSVGAGDLAIVQQNLGQPGTFATGDVNGDGIVDQTDYNIVFDNLGGGAICGTILNDVNDQGFITGGLTFLPGITVYLDVNNNGQLDPGEPSAVTDADGNYRFANLGAGTYVVRQVVPQGWAFTAPSFGFQQPTTIVVPAGEWALGPQFSDVQISTIPMDSSYLAKVNAWMGRAGTFAQGDVNGDGIVDAQDLLIVEENFGHPIDELLNATSGNDVIVFTPQPDGKHIQWNMGNAAGEFLINDPNGITINGNGGQDSLWFQYYNNSSVNPLPGVVHLNGNFSIGNWLNMNGTTLDIGNSTVYFDTWYSDPPVAQYLANGYNAGAWNGIATAAAAAITSTAAQLNSTHNTAIGYADAADGQRVDTVPGTIELKYTLYGDANLDGQVNSADLQRLLFALNTPGGWDQGDFNYDGIVNGADLQPLLFNLNTGLGNQLLASVTQASAQVRLSASPAHSAAVAGNNLSMPTVSTHGSAMSHADRRSGRLQKHR